MRTLEQMKDNAQRQLDGMTVNRDLMAKDVLWLADTVKRLETLVKNQNQAATPPTSGPLGSAFDEIFRKRGAKA